MLEESTWHKWIDKQPNVILKSNYTYLLSFSQNLISNPRSTETATKQTSKIIIVANAALTLALLLGYPCSSLELLNFITIM